MINHSEWEYENQDYLKEHYEKRLMGKDTHLFVRKFHCKGCGRVFYTTIETKKYCLYSLCGNHGYQKELKWRREQEHKDRICQTCGNPLRPSGRMPSSAAMPADRKHTEKVLRIRQVVTLTTCNNRNEKSVTVRQVPKSGTYNNRNDIKPPKGDEPYESAL